MVVGIILCSGRSKRMEVDTPKCLLKIKGKPIFIYSIEEFLKVKDVNEIYVVADEAHIMQYRDWLIKFKLIRKVKLIIGSYLSRHQSLKIAIAKVNAELRLKNDDIIVSHDGARPTVDLETIQKNIQIARKYQVASTVQTSDDTICHASKFMYRTFSRKKTYIVLTPQTFTYRIWQDSCCLHLPWSKKELPDAFSYLWKKPRTHSLVLAKELNWKITRPSDLELAKYVIYEE